MEEGHTAPQQDFLGTAQTCSGQPQKGVTASVVWVPRAFQDLQRPGIEEGWHSSPSRAHEGLTLPEESCRVRMVHSFTWSVIVLKFLLVGVSSYPSFRHCHICSLSTGMGRAKERCAFTVAVTVCRNHTWGRALVTESTRELKLERQEGKKTGMDREEEAKGST